MMDYMAAPCSKIRHAHPAATAIFTTAIDDRTPLTTGPTQAILFQNGRHDWREKNFTPGTSTNFFFSGFQLSQPRVCIINMCREVRHAAALLTQSLHTLFQSIGQRHRVCHYRPQGTPEICTQKTCYDGCGFPGAVPLVPFGSHRTPSSFSARKTKVGIFRHFF
ncbi:hypothetical protein QR685DRAFT_571385 [Neurospora intermedia]|uniref:Uncharacterized protein n=1 Tax=Neurospora intermedia TaxID=5142 RepID=A0ABR3DC36_NEUIN